MANPLRILVVDDDPLVRHSYRTFFAQHAEYEVAGEARDGAEGVTAYGSVQPDAVLMDLQMPVLTGIEAIEEICRRWPDACIVAMTTFGTSDYIVKALRAGAAGYLMKDVGGPGLLIGLRQAVNGDMPLSVNVRRELVGVVSAERGRTPVPASDIGLTPRERELLSWLAQGLTNQQIGAKIFLSEGSVKQYLLSIGNKLHIRSRTGIVIKAVQLGLIDPHALPPVS